MNLGARLTEASLRSLTVVVFLGAAMWAGVYVHHARFAAQSIARYEEPAIAIHLAHKEGFLTPYRQGSTAPLSSWSPPLYPYFASKVLRAFGDDTVRSRQILLAINALLYGGAAAGLFALAAALFGRPAGGVSVGAFLLNPFVLRWTGSVWDTCLALALFTWLLVAAIHLRRTPRIARSRIGRFAAFGAALGLLCLANPSYVLAVVALLWIAAGNLSWRARIAAWAIALAAFALVVTPWTVRNASAFNKITFVRGNAPFELYFGNRPETTGWLTPGSFDVGHPSEDPAERKLILRIGEARYFELSARRFRTLLRADPLGFAAHCLHRVAYLFVGDPTQPSYAPGVPGGLWHGIFWGSVIGHSLFTIMGLAGAWLGWRLRLRTAWVLVPAVCSVAPFTVSSVWDKQLVPLEALLCIPAAVLITAVTYYCRTGAWPKPVVVGKRPTSKQLIKPRAPSRLRAWWDGRGAPVFNRRCLQAGLIWLAVSIPLGILIRPTEPDFGQFYVGAQVLRHGAWDALYPIPREDSLLNPGLKADSYMKPGWRALEQQYGVPTNTRFILPPPSTFIFFPLALFSFPVAFWLYTALASACVLAVGWQAARSLEIMAGRPTRWGGLLILLLACSPMSARAIRIANTTPFIAVAMGAVVFATLRPESWSRAARVALYILVGGLMKYATLVLLPLLVVARRWRSVSLALAFGALTTAAGYAVAGRATFATFSHDIAPRLDRIPFFFGNQSISGYLVRINDYDPRLPRMFRISLAVGRFGVLAMVGGLIVRRPRADWRRPEMAFAAAVALISWMMLYGPVMWEHYPIFAAPFWGWLLWEARRPGVKRWLGGIALALVNIPQGIFHVEGFLMHTIRLPEILNCTQTYGVLLMLAIATARLAEFQTVKREPGGSAAGSFPRREARLAQTLEGKLSYG